MKTNLVIFYSNKGSNQYLAEKLAFSLQSEIEEIKPRVKSMFLLMMGLGLGIKKVEARLSEYNRIILCGPIWMGRLIPPLKSFINNNINNIEEMVFLSCCGSSFEMKDKKFGHELVFQEVRKIMGHKCSHCEAFPIPLVLPKEQREDPNSVMQTRLTDNNFEGEIRQRFDALVDKLKH